MDRRTFLMGSALLSVGLPRLALAAAATDKRLVMVLLRGAYADSAAAGTGAIPPVRSANHPSTATPPAKTAPSRKASSGAMSTALRLTSLASTEQK